MKLLFRLTRGQAVGNFWFAGWFNSPKLKMRTERMFRRLEHEHAALTKAFG